ncbi:MAG: hypothetical protein P4L42_13705 [Desulfocapsaceae bacterium]|nr:hypothetical protein [Desulfocapsaceae bacterium]
MVIKIRPLGEEDEREPNERPLTAGRLVPQYIKYATWWYNSKGQKISRVKISFSVTTAVAKEQAVSLLYRKEHRGKKNLNLFDSQFRDLLYC